MNNKKGLLNLKPFKKGQSGNPNGRPPEPKEYKEAKALNKFLVAKILNRFSRVTHEEIKSIISHKRTPALDKLIACLIDEGIHNPSPVIMNFILDRMVGKVSEEVKVKVPTPTVIKLLGENAEAILLGSDKKEGED